MTTCPTGWFSTPYGCYASLMPADPPGIASHLACARECAAANGALACIGSREENAFVTQALLNQTVGAYNYYHEHWIGNYYHDGQWHCDAASESAYSAWYTAFGQPWYENSAGTPAYCAALEHGESHFNFDMSIYSAEVTDYVAWERETVVNDTGWLGGGWYTLSCHFGSSEHTSCLCKQTPSYDARTGPYLTRYGEELERSSLEPFVWDVLLLPWLVPTLIVALLPVTLLLLHITCSKLTTAKHTAATRVRKGSLALRGVVATDGGDGESREATRWLRSTRRASRKVRLRVSGGAFAIGFMLVTLSVAPFFANNIMTPCCFTYRQRHFWPQNGAVQGLHWLALVLAPPGGCMMLLALLPIDVRGIKLTSFVMALIGLVICATAILLLTWSPDIAKFGAGFVITSATLFLGSFLWAVSSLYSLWLLQKAPAAGAPAGCCRPRGNTWSALMAEHDSRAALKRLWLAGRCYLLCLAIERAVFIVVMFATFGASTFADTFVAQNIAILASCILCSAAMTPRVRARVQHALGSCGLQDEARSAAIVSALVARVGAAKALKDARQNFRALPLDQLTAADLGAAGANLADSDLANKTIRVKLGTCTFFFSHSWRDAAQPKWEALKAWEAEYKARTNTDSLTMWLDKACIDQTNIDASLACLPVFLAGCKQLLVVAGATYHTRLWCVMELFTFCVSGGDIETIEVVPIADADATSPQSINSSRQLVFENLANIDASQAQCFKPEDRSHLLGVIEAGFGSFDAFNSRCRAVLTKRTRLLDGQVIVGTEMATVPPPPESVI